MLSPTSFTTEVFRHPTNMHARMSRLYFRKSRDPELCSRIRHQCYGLLCLAAVDWTLWNWIRDAVLGVPRWQFSRRYFQPDGCVLQRERMIPDFTFCHHNVLLRSAST